MRLCGPQHHRSDIQATSRRLSIFHPHSLCARHLFRFASVAAVTAAAALLPAHAAPATTTTLHLDPGATEIHYTTGSALHRVHGTFALKGGMLAFDPASGVAQGQILVDAASGHASDRKLDAKMQSEVLESGKYPEIFFHPEKSVGHLKEGSEERLTLIGSFNIHGADHPLKVEALVTIHGEEAVAKVDFDVPYVEWGMKDASTILMHARTVHVSMTTHAKVETARQ